MPDNAYIYTDMAIESCLSSDISERAVGRVTVSSVDVGTDVVSSVVKKPPGRYVTLAFEPLYENDDELCSEITSVLSDELAVFVGDAKRLLVVGLGSRHMTPDSLGPLCADRVLVTRHLGIHEPQLFSTLGMRECAAFIPGVVGRTGIETLELVQGACEKIRPDLLIVVDSLCSRSTERLASTVQLTDSGIAPGSGIGNRRRAISRETTGVPTIAIGAPTIVSSATLVCDALEKAGMTDIPSELEAVLEQGRSYHVTPKDCASAVTELARIIADAIDTVITS